ncbi:2-oxoglutarate-malate translocator [Sporolactobacillus inulinus]|uniref:2-oxoglutarate-malate translocator n=1 Tax=Sporolactobacillus inulinus TaxID=2078 RepID=A0A4Y1Z951_9BACL|nr:2-oxoglutarate-malate translocator [Sporolactobacillus inulinus]
MTLEKISYKKFLIPVLVGVILWLLTPIKPAAVSPAAWHMFAILSPPLSAASPSHCRLALWP